MKTYRRIVRKRLQAALTLTLPKGKGKGPVKGDQPRVVIDGFDELPSEPIDLEPSPA